jgi:hypothetical protein
LECSREEAFNRCKEFALNFSPGRVSEWFKLIDTLTNLKIDPSLMNPKKAGGWARHAFVIAFHLLRHPDVNYVLAI